MRPDPKRSMIPTSDDIRDVSLGHFVSVHTHLNSLRLNSSGFRDKSDKNCSKNAHVRPCPQAGVIRFLGQALQVGLNRLPAHPLPGCSAASCHRKQSLKVVYHILASSADAKCNHHWLQLVSICTNLPGQRRPLAPVPLAPLRFHPHASIRRVSHVLSIFTYKVR